MSRPLFCQVGNEMDNILGTSLDMDAREFAFEDDAVIPEQLRHTQEGSMNSLDGVQTRSRNGEDIVTGPASSEILTEQDLTVKTCNKPYKIVSRQSSDNTDINLTRWGYQLHFRSRGI